MRIVNRSALVTYSTQQMFELVDDVDSYAEFLPWCHRSAVVSRTSEIVEAMVELQKGNIRKAFTTRNTLRKHESIELELLNGPFRSLSGGWSFDHLGSDGSKVTLALQFEFESRLVDMMFGAFFEETCNSLVDAFTRRAAQVYDS